MEIKEEIRLEPITNKNYSEILELTVKNEQKNFVADNYKSFCQAHFDKASWLRGVYLRDNPAQICSPSSHQIKTSWPTKLPIRHLGVRTMSKKPKRKFSDQVNRMAVEDYVTGPRTPMISSPQTALAPFQFRSLSLLSPTLSSLGFDGLLPNSFWSSFLAYPASI